ERGDDTVPQGGAGAGLPRAGRDRHAVRADSGVPRIFRAAGHHAREPARAGAHQLLMLGKAAVAIWCDVAYGVRPEFDNWHAHEHMPERLAIPGFLRGSRWVAERGEGYFILYEVQNEAVIAGEAYLKRLNNPTLWSRKMMPHHRNMVRGLCRVEASGGTALGQALATIRFSADGARSAQLLPWMRNTLATLPHREGLVAAAPLREIGRA